MEETKPTPMMEQYLRIKKEHQDALLFFRLGDFYEMFFEDAEKASRILDIALTSRNKGEPERVPLCGVPHHSVTPYVHKLLQAGYKVAICDQMEDPSLAKGIVRREVVRVITPGTASDDGVLEADSNRYLVSLATGGGRWGLAVADVTTGEFRMTEVREVESLYEEVRRLAPKEILLPQHPGDLDGLGNLAGAIGAMANFLDPTLFDFAQAKSRIEEHDLWQAEHEEWPVALSAAGALIAYLCRNRVGEIRGLTRLESYRLDRHLIIDETARRHLELTETIDGNRSGSLLAVLDHTLTAMGRRRLKHWIQVPLQDRGEIVRRHDAVEELLGAPSLRESLRIAIRTIQDLERLRSRVLGGRVNARDLVQLRCALEALPPVLHLLQGSASGLLQELRQGIHPLPEVVDTILHALPDDPPLNPRPGSVIREGYSQELDEIRSGSRDTKQWIAALEAEERKRTGIASLKVRYNRVYGYYIEVSKPNLHLIPAHYTRKQSLVGAERFITPDLKEKESRLAASEEFMRKIEAGILEALVATVAERQAEILSTAQGVASLDVLLSLAEAACRQGYVRPLVDESTDLVIRAGRHPALEALEPAGRFVENDCLMDLDTNQILVLTGPNMAGKSTFLRQAALIVLMAQMGSFVPAAEARIGIVDRIFTRVGAGDRLSRGDSTFMVEMREVAEILRSATPRSLILLDEVGRGTSTFDGISIAWSVVEHLHDTPSLRSKTLFATHFHELTDLALTKPRVKNYNVAVREWGDEIVFLRKILPGGSSRSYGIHVAMLAGLPPSVIHRAREILFNLEKGEIGEAGSPRIAEKHAPSAEEQLELFSEGQALVEELRKIDINHLTPLEALQRLNALVQEASAVAPPAPRPRRGGELPC
jgi:DNA mismatch repair protein MutS